MKYVGQNCFQTLPKLGGSFKYILHPIIYFPNGLHQNCKDSNGVIFCFNNYFRKIPILTGSFVKWIETIN